MYDTRKDQLKVRINPNFKNINVRLNCWAIIRAIEMRIKQYRLFISIKKMSPTMYQAELKKDRVTPYDL